MFCKLSDKPRIVSTLIFEEEETAFTPRRPWKILLFSNKTVSYQKNLNFQEEKLPKKHTGLDGLSNVL